MNIGNISSSGPVIITDLQKQQASIVRHQEKQQKKVKIAVPDLNETKHILDEFTRNTRFSYSINERLTDLLSK